MNTYIPCVIDSDESVLYIYSINYLNKATLVFTKEFRLI